MGKPRKPNKLVTINLTLTQAPFKQLEETMHTDSGVDIISHATVKSNETVKDFVMSTRTLRPVTPPSPSFSIWWMRTGKFPEQPSRYIIYQYQSTRKVSCGLVVSMESQELDPIRQGGQRSFLTPFIPAGPG